MTKIALAAEAGDELARVKLAALCLLGKAVPQDDERAVYWLERAGETLEGPGAEALVGFAYYWGQGVARNIDKAAWWYRQGAEKGHAEAQYLLGQFFNDGDGVARNYETAAQWFLKAAEQNHRMAQNCLGGAYKNGLGVPKDREKSMYWYQRAWNERSAERRDKNARDLWLKELQACRNL